jgi:nitrogen fixation protein FixH
MGVVIAVNVVMAVIAISTFAGLETEDHYRKGLAYNRNLAAAQAQAARGWQMRVEFAAAATAADQHQGEIAAVFTDRTGQPLDRLTVEATLIRPTHAGADLSLPLEYVGGGRYRGAVTVPMPGQWDARILARQDDQHFQDTRRLFVP